MTNHKERAARKAADALLAADGFHDIERPNGDLKPMIHVDMAKRLEHEGNAADRITLARQYYHDGDFDNDEQRECWGHYAEGLSYRQISTAMGWGPTNTKRVFLNVVPIRERMLERLRPKRGRRGRPPLPDGRNADSTRIASRLNTRETDALWMLAEASRITPNEAARRSFLLVATLVMQGKLPVTCLDSMAQPEMSRDDD